ncbi:MAG TPA: disulfide bond formation protein DsbA [Cyanobacteria bacterium UBA11049]|nr:disulfide bond formation protein DsbA [Cyanobacteria bacterium UBA11049]
MTLNIAIFSDLICPWCFIGKRRLSKAISLLDEKSEFYTAWYPFQLNPQMPPEGMDRKVYRTAKFGSWSKSLKLDAQVVEVGATEGIHFAFDRIQRTPNTLNAHRLVWLAGKEGIQDALVEALFQSYFTQGKDISDRSILIDIAQRTGLSSANVESLFYSGEGVEAVCQEEEKARQLKIGGVPLFIVNGKFGLSGAQLPNVFIALFEKVMQLEND